MRSDGTSAMTPAQYYDARHERGWMDAWPPDKRRRMVALIRALELPERARVLEFGCGVGVFAAAVQEAFPTLDVHACDISATAIARARLRFPQVRFHLLPDDGCRPAGAAYDLVFTHHVLEHVQDLESVLAHIARVLRPGGLALHVFPCGNAGSLEYRIACLTRQGILPGGLFWIDDTSHVRRLGSSELEQLSRKHGFALRQAHFMNQFWGGIEYLTDTYPPTALEWLRTLRGRDRRASLRLLGVLAGLNAVCLIRKGPSHVWTAARRPGLTAQRVSCMAALPLAALIWPLSRLAAMLCRWARDREWRRSRLLPNGSEAYLTFERQ